jgi:NAD(P)-dependent dehydrogenase (short-subunit alcohol dehydrogenase family)
MRDLAGKICLVTGGTQGVGEATARLMCDRGASGIVICGRQRRAGERIANELEEKGTSVKYVEADLANVQDCFAVVDTAETAFGRLDIVANVAGITDRGTIENTSVETFDRLFAVNTRAPFFIIQRAVPLLRKSGCGAIVNVISIAAHGGAPFISAYVGSKSALVGLTKNIAQSLRYDKIRVNGLNMGWTATPGEERIQRTAHGRGDNWLSDISAKQPFGRLLTSVEVARAVLFLATDESAIVTGSVVDFDQLVVGAYD